MVGESGTTPTPEDFQEETEDFGLGVEGTDAATEAQPTEEASAEEEPPSEEESSDESGPHRLDERGNGWYDVVDADGEPQNDTALRKDAATDLRDKLNS